MDEQQQNGSLVGRKPLDFPADEQVDYKDEMFKSKTFPSILVLVLSTVLVVVSSFYLYKHFAKKTDVHQLPVIRADKEQIKIKPDNPGGMEVLNMDKTIYDDLSSTPNKVKAANENILPEPEEPIDKRKLLMGEVESNLQNSSVEAQTSQQPQDQQAKDMEEVMKKEDVPLQATENVDQARSIGTHDKNKDSTAVAPKPAADQSKITLKTKETTESKPKKHERSLSGNVALQIASLKTNGDAENEWHRIEKTYSNVLSGYKHRIEKKDLPSKGTVYRLQIYGFTSDSDARSVCNKLKAHGQGCFLAK